MKMLQFVHGNKNVPCPVMHIAQHARVRRIYEVVLVPEALIMPRHVLLDMECTAANQAFPGVCISTQALELRTIVPAPAAIQRIRH